MDFASEKLDSIAFGPLRVVPHRRELPARGGSIRLGGCALDTSVTLIEARGAVVGKDALIARVWPDRAVEENSPLSQIAALRRAFGADRDLIRTAFGRGYQHTGEIRVLAFWRRARTNSGNLSGERQTASPSHAKSAWSTQHP